MSLNNKLWNKRRGQGQISKELKSLYTPTAWESANHAKTGERKEGGMWQINRGGKGEMKERKGERTKKEMAGG